MTIRTDQLPTGYFNAHTWTSYTGKGDYDAQWRAFVAKHGYEPEYCYEPKRRGKVAYRYFGPVRKDNDE